MSGRDLVGYGPSPPDPQWPGGARLALSFVLNYEEGGERTPLEGDAEAESYLHEVVGAPPTVGRRNLNVESMFEFGSRAGFWRVHRIFGKHGLPLTVYAVGQALERNPEAARAMVDAGWEVASHGWRWIDYAEVPEAEEREHLRRAIEAIERVCGVRPVGWYTGRISENTRRLVVEEGGFLYDSDDYSDELPYWVEVAGTQHLVIPYTLDANDFKFLIPNGFVTADDFHTYLVDTFEQLYAEGGRMMSVGLHCRITGRPGRAPAIDRFLEHVKPVSDVWVTTRAEIARHWRAHHPPARQLVRLAGSLTFESRRHRGNADPAADPRPARGPTGQLLQGGRRQGRRRDRRPFRRRRDADRPDRPGGVYRRRRDPPHVHRLLRQLGLDLPRDQEHRRRAGGAGRSRPSRATSAS